ncbi:hypothetical protein I4U23_003892 [Adineta vaga]|nr:hypothetical protein I4U23_003892 [Adineta vaga]
MTKIQAAEEENAPFQGEDISPDEDEGLIKQIVRQGSGDDKPLYDDQVTIHYVGSELDGKVFSNSRDRDEKVSFSLGKNEVIPAWDLGAATMKRGEIARFFAKPKYAYGVKGEKKYRSATSVIFEIELLDFVGKDISDEKDGSIIRRIIRRGEGRELPNEDSTVEIHLKGTYQGKIFDERTVQFVVGLGFLQQIPLGIERIIYKMLRNEKCQFILKGKALEGLDKVSISPDESIQYELTLINFERMESEELLTNKRKFERAELLKARADDLVKKGHYELAIKRYQIVSHLLSSVTFPDKDDRVKSRQVQIAAHSNIALCYMKLNDHLQCKTACDETLALDAKNEKCLFRRGQCHFLFSNFEKAIQDFEAVLKINPTNVAAQQQIEQCEQQRKEHETKQKQSYKTFFNDSSRPSLFEVDDKYEEVKKNMQEKNALKSLGLEPISLESLGIHPPKRPPNNGT